MHSRSSASAAVQCRDQSFFTKSIFAVLHTMNYSKSALFAVDVNMD